MYFGQQNIQAGVIDSNSGQFNTTGNIADQNAMNNITYQVNANPTEATGT